MKKLKEKMLSLGLKPKNELIKLVVVNFVLLCGSVVLFIFFKDLIYTLSCLGIAIIFDLAFLTRYSKLINAKNTQNLMEFSTLFGYFKIYIHNGYSVYSALKELINFANNDLKNYLNTLISEIDNDKSVQPFINFAKRFNEIIVEEMMISIYQLIDDGETSDYLVQFELIFDKFSDILHENYLRNKDKKLGTLSSAPLIGSCFLIIVLTIGVIGIIGAIINGI